MRGESFFRETVTQPMDPFRRSERYLGTDALTLLKSASRSRHRIPTSFHLSEILLKAPSWHQLTFLPGLNSQAEGQLLAWTATSQEFPDTRECASPREHTRGTGVTDSLGALFLFKREGEGDLWDPAGS